MASSFLAVVGLVLVSHLYTCLAAPSSEISKIFGRSAFPKGFVFGAGTSAFQFEGAVKEDGRKPSIWDVFSHTPGAIKDGSNADVAMDHYHRYKEDIGILADMGGDAFRFSISWTRILPDGTGKVNQAGIDHYNQVINESLRRGLQPYVTIFHWDSPQALEVKYGGVLNPQFAKDYAAYAEVLFEAFGDRVKHWTTFNEAHSFCIQGYSNGLFAPGRCSKEVGNCTKGDSSTEPYICSHHILLAHAEATNIYHKKFQASQGGEIGITLDVQYYFPYSNTKRDREAVERTLQFNLGWFLNPIIYGDYPALMRSIVGNRLPKFTKEESAKLKTSVDFVGVNHYTTVYAADPKTKLESPDILAPKNSLFHPTYYKDGQVQFSDTRKGKLLGQNINGFYVVPTGIRKLMNYIRVHYNNPKVYITESGISDSTTDSVPLKVALNDVTRINYYRKYLLNLSLAIKDGCNVKAYFAWTLLDTWEWFSGYAQRFGLVHIDYKNNLKRIPKKSFKWFKNFLSN